MLRSVALKTYSVTKDQFIPVSKLFHEGAESSLIDHQRQFDQALDECQDNLNEDLDYPSYMLSLTFPGEAKKGKQGHQCRTVVEQTMNRWKSNEMAEVEVQDQSDSQDDSVDHEQDVDADHEEQDKTVTSDEHTYPMTV